MALCRFYYYCPESICFFSWYLFVVVFFCCRACHLSSSLSCSSLKGTDESGILLKTLYARTVGHCLEQLGIWGCAVSLPVGPGQSPGGSSRDPAVHSTKKCPPKATVLVHFYLCAAYKLKGKIHFKQNYVQGKYFNLMLCEHLKAHLMVVLKHGRHNELTSFQHNHYF